MTPHWGREHFGLPRPQAISLQMMILEEPSWEAVWPFLNDPEILQMCATAQEFNDATEYGPYFELFFFLMHRETDSTKPIADRHVSTVQ